MGVPQRALTGPYFLSNSLSNVNSRSGFRGRRRKLDFAFNMYTSIYATLQMGLTF
jgi:hypothetical protein